MLSIRSASPTCAPSTSQVRCTVPATLTPNFFFGPSRHCMENMAVCPTLLCCVLPKVFREIVKFSNEDFADAFARLGLDGCQNNVRLVDAGFVPRADVRLLERRAPTEEELRFLTGRKSVPFADSLLWPFAPSRPRVLVQLPSGSSTAGARSTATSQDHSQLPWDEDTQQTQGEGAASSKVKEPAMKKLRHDIRAWHVKRRE